MIPVIAMPNVRGGLFRAYMKRKYVTSLARAGARVRWIDMEDADKAVEQMLECDGLLLPGGGDVNPERYGQAILECCGKPDDLRDRAEVAMLDKPSMTAEDFSWYQRYAAGIFFFLGLGDVPALHASNFNFDETILEKGADFFEKLAENFQ